MKEINFKFVLHMLAWAFTWGEVFKNWTNTWVCIQSGKPRTLKSSQKHDYTVKSKKKLYSTVRATVFYRVDTFKTRQLFEWPITKAQKTTSYIYLDLNGSANSLTHDLPFTKGGSSTSGLRGGELIWSGPSPGGCRMWGNSSLSCSC